MTPELHKLVSELMWWHGFMVGMIVQGVIVLIIRGLYNMGNIPVKNETSQSPPESQPPPEEGIKPPEPTFKVGNVVYVIPIQKIGDVCWVVDDRVGVCLGKTGTVINFSPSDLRLQY